MADWGMKLTSDQAVNKDVNTATGTDLIFTSGKPTIPVVMSGTVVINIAADSFDTTGALAISLPLGLYIPVATTVLNGKRFVSNAPALLGFGVNPTDGHFLEGNLTSHDSTSNVALITVGRYASSSSKNGIAESYTVRWFLVSVENG